MASPQVENGYTRLANELLEAILNFPFSGAQLKVLLALVRASYGWARKHAPLSRGQIARMCRIRRDRVGVAIRELKSMNIINEEAGAFLIEKDYELWRLPLSKGVSLNKVSTKSGYTKSGYTKGVQKCTENREGGIPKIGTGMASNPAPNVGLEDPKEIFKEKKKDIELFLSFWKAYPRKVAKAQALKAWKKALKKPSFPRENILSILGRHKNQRQWLENEGRYIPHASTWLNQERWEDEIEIYKKRWDEE